MIRNQTVVHIVIVVLVKEAITPTTKMRHSIRISQWIVNIRTIHLIMIQEIIKPTVMKKMKMTVRNIQRVVIVVVVIKEEDIIRNKSQSINLEDKAKRIEN